MLYFNLYPIFQARGIENPYTFLVKAGIPRHTAHNVLSSKTRTLRLETIEALCRILICEPNDLLLYIPDENQKLHPEHPLNNLMQTEPPESIMKTIANMPFSQLKEITKQITENNK